LTDDVGHGCGPCGSDSPAATHGLSLAIIGQILMFNKRLPKQENIENVDSGE
jgi:hypothetical protein